MIPAAPEGPAPRTGEVPVKGLWGEFKAFALGGNMLDLALAIRRR